MDSAATTHDVIVISDDEDETTVETSSSRRAGPFSWSTVADQLLVLAKHSEMRADQKASETLLQDIGAPSSIVLRDHLHATCERLGELLQLSKTHARRYRASEELVLVVCEVLSLAQTTPAQEPREMEVVKEELELGFTVDDMLQLTNKWSGMLGECSRTRLGRERALGSTVTRLEKLMQLCTDEVRRRAGRVAEYEAKREQAAQQWKNVLDKCCDMVVRQPKPFDGTMVAFETALELTKRETAAFYAHSQARTALLQLSKETEMRRAFFAAALQLTFTIAELPGARDEPDEKLMLLESDILASVDSFCGGLRNAVELAETSNQLPFATKFKLFWLIRRGWFRPAVLEVVSASLDAVLRSTQQSVSPLCTAISRVCAGLRAG
jgi:hypothetical protein